MCHRVERKEISKSVLKRLPGYLSYLKSIPEGEAVYISATALANALSMGEVQVRKDLAMVSDGGRPKIGYLRSQLVEDISQFLGYDNTTDAILVGAGKLGQALMGYKGFDAYGLNILAAFDVDPVADLYQNEGHLSNIAEKDDHHHGFDRRHQPSGRPDAGCRSRTDGRQFDRHDGLRSG